MMVKNIKLQRKSTFFLRLIVSEQVFVPLSEEQGRNQHRTIIV